MCGELEEGAIALVTGANRGLGLHFVEALVEFGAAKIYATARNIDTLAPLVRKHEGLVVPLGLDVTEQAQVDAVAEAAQDVTLLLNSAGVLDGRSLLEAPSSICRSSARSPRLSESRDWIKLRRLRWYSISDSR